MFFSKLQRKYSSKILEVVVLIELSQKIYYNNKKLLLEIFIIVRPYLSGRFLSQTKSMHERCHEISQHIKYI